MHTSGFSLVNGPIIVSDKTSEGWHDLILYVSGGGAVAFYAKLQFDGASYPINPSMAPALSSEGPVLGMAILADDMALFRGIENTKQERQQVKN